MLSIAITFEKPILLNYRMNPEEWRRERDLNPRDHAVTGFLDDFPGLRPSRLGDPGTKICNNLEPIYLSFENIIYWMID
jgi:hypothetical protein